MDRIMNIINQKQIYKEMYDNNQSFRFMVNTYRDSENKDLDFIQIMFGVYKQIDGLQKEIMEVYEMVDTFYEVKKPLTARATAEYQARIELKKRAFIQDMQEEQRPIIDKAFKDLYYYGNWPAPNNEVNNTNILPKMEDKPFKAKPLRRNTK